MRTSAVHCHINARPTGGSKAPIEGPEQEPPDSSRSLQDHPYTVLGDRDVGAATRPIFQQEASRLRKPALAPGSIVRRGPRGPYNNSRLLDRRGLQQSL